MRKTISAVMVLVCILVVLELPLAAKERDWRIGRLKSSTDESWTSSTTTPINCGSGGGYASCAGGQTTNWGHETYYVTIMEGSQTYYATRTLSWRWQRSPKLTENGQIKFAVEGDKLYLLDDEGKEFKMYVGKKRNNTPAEQLEECRTTVEELHEIYPGLSELNTWMAGLSGQELLNTYISEMDCATTSMQMRDMPLLSQYEMIRAEMLLARAAKDAPLPKEKKTDSIDECRAIATKIQSEPLKDLKADQVSESASRLYECAMSSYQTDRQTWFLPTASARHKLLVEIISRQTGAALGEHEVRLPIASPPKSDKPW